MKTPHIKNQRTLFQRLVMIISLLAFSIVVLFTVATLLITYSFEDVLLNERLQQAHIKLKNGESLPYNITLVESLNELEPDLFQKLLYLEFNNDNDYGEFGFEGRHYHYLVTEEGTILYDTTNLSIVDRALEDVFLVLAMLVIPTIFLTYWVAKISSRYALKPFSQLSSLFIDSKNQAFVEDRLLDEIREQDVKEVALELQHALKQKGELLDQQVVFNQGMAHELRTPIQVINHSVELLKENQQSLAHLPSFKRLEKAMNRMSRLSEGLLWLTSEQQYEEQIDVQQTLEKVVESLLDTANAHKIKVDITIKNNFTLAMPEPVFELIIFNLFNNVVNHGSENNRQSNWTITVENHQIIFSNPIADAGNKNVFEHNFGIGLTLVSRLAHRFSISVSNKHLNQKFVTIFKKN